MKILILYFSGVGNTRMVAEQYYKRWEVMHICDLYPINKVPVNLDISQYGCIVLGTPTYHATPAKPILDYLDKLTPLSKPLPAFLFTTCGLYPANTLRILACICREKNIVTIMSQSYRCAATDGMLLAPSMKLWFKHEKHLQQKINRDAVTFLTYIEQPSLKERMPRFRIHGIFNYPNKILGKHYHPVIYLHNVRCIQCGKCILNCPIQCITKAYDGSPVINSDQCINCYRCVHHCPSIALSLSPKKTLQKTMFYQYK